MPFDAGGETVTVISAENRGIPLREGASHAQIADIATRYRRI